MTGAAKDASERPSWALEVNSNSNVITYDDLIPPKIVKSVDDYEPTAATRRRRSLGTLTRRRRYSGGRSANTSVGRIGRRSSFGQTTRTSPTAKVKFTNPIVSDKIPCSHGKLSRQEVKTIWYKSRDYESFENDKKKTIQKLRAAGGDVTRLNPAKYCLRGIEEYQCMEHYSHQRRKRLECVQRVLVEQERQRYLKVVDPEAFCGISLQYSVEQMEMAMYRGQRDERHAKEVHEEGRRTSGRGSLTSRSGLRAQRRVSQRYVPVDASPSAEVPRSTKRDSLNLTKLKGSIAAFRELMESDPELQDLLTEDDDDEDDEVKSNDDTATPDTANDGLSLAELCALIDDPSDDENNDNNDGDDNDDDDSIPGLNDNNMRPTGSPVRLALNDSLSKLPHIVRQRRPGGIA